MRQWFWLLSVVVGISLGLALPAHAQEPTLASEVEVDVTGNDAEDARTKAMSQAEREGLLNLLNKFAPGQAEKAVDPLTAAEITAIARGIEVLEENISGNRYRARLSMSYDADAIDRLLGKAIEPPKSALAGGSGGVLVFPVFDQSGELMLWESKNPWRAALSQAAIMQGRGHVIVPFGDSTDNSYVDVANVLAINYDVIIPLLERYGTGDAVVLQGRLMGGDEHPTLQVMRRTVTPGGDDEVGLLTYTASDDETIEKLLMRVARDIARQLADKRSADKAIADYHNTPGNKQMAVVSISTLAAWTDIRKRLTEINLIERIEMLAMAPKQVDVQILYRGDPEGLKQAIEAANLRVVPSGNYWVIGR